MSRPDEGLIHQWLDGECTREESARIEALVASDPAWAAAVAEARGLIAASSRIVGALDAVPRATPSAAPSAASAPRQRRRAVPSWAGLAAGLVLVAGTAYVLREKSTEPFATVTMPSTDALPAAFDTAPGVQIANDRQLLQSPREVPPAGGLSQAQGQGAATTPAAPSVAATAAAPTTPAPTTTAPALADPSAPAARGEVDAAKRRAVEEAASRERVQDAAARRAQLAADSPRGALARDAVPTSAAAAPAPPPLPTLPGCWRVSAPPELAGVLEAPEIRRASGDTLVLVTARGDVTVTRAGTRLSGGLNAIQEPCGQDAPN